MDSTVRNLMIELNFDHSFLNTLPHLYFHERKVIQTKALLVLQVVSLHVIRYYFNKRSY